jgi:hypothetical protein
LPSNDADDLDPDDDGELDDDDVKSEWVDDDEISCQPSHTLNPCCPAHGGNGPLDGSSDDSNNGDNDSDGDDNEDFIPELSEASSNSTT